MQRGGSETIRLSGQLVFHAKKAGWRHVRDLPKGMRERGSTGKAEFGRHPGDRVSSGEVIHGLHDTSPLPPGLKCQACL